jgi:phospholipid-binding lipoprotein MlaA
MTSRLLAFLAALLLCSCATTGATDPRDPWEGMNRGTFKFNDAMDKAILKPIATGYDKVLPGPVKTASTTSTRTWPTLPRG